MSVDNEIKNASEYIDSRLSEMNIDNRNEKSQEILGYVRNLNDNIAYKIWNELYPSKPCSIKNVASKFVSVKKYHIIGNFDRYLQKSLSHFTPSIDGAGRLMLKYYSFLLSLKAIYEERYGQTILKNINSFIENCDFQTNEYYNIVSKEIDYCSNNSKSGMSDIFYIKKVNPFFVDKKIYYEITAVNANDFENKYNRITCFSAKKISDYYSASLTLVERIINVNGLIIPIFIITDSYVSIRPCELRNFSKIFDVELKIERNYIEYRSLMKLLTDYDINLLDVIDSDDSLYKNFRDEVEKSIKSKKSTFFDVLNICRKISKENLSGKNIIRYLLVSLNNKTIKNQWPDEDGSQYNELYLSTKCYPFEQHPFTFNPKDSILNIYDVLTSYDGDNLTENLLAYTIKNNAEHHKILYTDIDLLKNFGDESQIDILIEKYNTSLYYKHREENRLVRYKNYVYQNSYEKNTKKIIELLIKLSKEKSNYDTYFGDDFVSGLCAADGDDKLDDPNKKSILLNMYLKSRVSLIYGSAGTGKTTIVKHVANLMKDCKIVFLAKTNTAVYNLKKKVGVKRKGFDFFTIDYFIHSKNYLYYSYDLYVFDECSTIKNDEFLNILSAITDGIVLLTGDIYQIDSIGYGNWFKIAYYVLKDSGSIYELNIPFRSTDDVLLSLWKEVRNMGDDNTVVEKTVRNTFSSPICNDIISDKNDDEIILCLNYNGLYGLNNINKLMQQSNSNNYTYIGVNKYIENDPIIFSETKRFPMLFNNLKGKIIKIKDFGDYSVEFTVLVDTLFDDEEKRSDEIRILSEHDNKTLISFIIFRVQPYYSDNDSIIDDSVVPFQVSYALSIHKAQGLEYDSVKIVISNDSERNITHDIFYTAITRARKRLMIYWSPEVSDRILKDIRPSRYDKDQNILINKFKL